MGQAISLFERATSAIEGPRLRFLAGTLVAVTLPALTYGSTHVLRKIVPSRLRGVIDVALISSTISMRGLACAAYTVERELEREDLPAARARVAEMVGRDTARLDGAEIARAAVESVAENTNDGVVAPATYALALGAPGALAYKAINTLDSMIGHPSPRYRELGRASARLDDLANLLPARLTALAVAAVSGRPSKVLYTACRYGPLTSSPNAGWSEAAFAGSLDLRLGGTSSYGAVARTGPYLGDGRSPDAADIARAIVLMRRCCLFLIVAAFAAGEVA
jgi:adenosylcobinamide-phosphate synthase